MTHLHIHLSSLLIDLEYELRRAQLWGSMPPSDTALASIEPFCVDTMLFQDWLQFVFLPRMRLLLSNRDPLPNQCNIATMAETVWMGTPAAKPVIAVLQAFDASLNDRQ